MATTPRELMLTLGQQAKAAAARLSIAPTEAKNEALRAAANALREESSAILAANAIDTDKARANGRDAA
ncbi:MAG: hypothetical protein AAF830_14990 [Pseudomonadota bacterium]